MRIPAHIREKPLHELLEEATMLEYLLDEVEKRWTCLLDNDTKWQLSYGQLEIVPRFQSKVSNTPRTPRDAIRVAMKKCERQHKDAKTLTTFGESAGDERSETT